MSAFGGKADIGHGSPCHPVRAGFAMTTLRRRCSWNRRAGADTERGLNPVGGSAQAMFYKRAG